MKCDSFSHSLQNWAADPEKDAEEREKEAAEKEDKDEREDEEELQRARAMDEWKDGELALVDTDIEIPTIIHFTYHCTRT